MKFRQKTYVFLFAFILSACGTDETFVPGEDDKPKTPVENPVDESEADPVVYSLVATPLLLNQQFIEPALFTLPKKSLENQKVTIAFNFNSKTHTTMKLLMERSESLCEGSLPGVEKLLVKYGPKREVLEKNVNVAFSYSLEPNINYAIEVVSSPSNCDHYSFGITLWTGSWNQTPEIVRNCTSFSNGLAGNFYHLMNQVPITILESFDTLLVGGNLLCGKEVAASEKEWTISYAPYTAHGHF